MAKAKAPAQQWEYLALLEEWELEKFKQLLAARGAEGWELVALEPRGPGYYFLVFKRPAS